MLSVSKYHNTLKITEGGFASLILCLWQALRLEIRKKQGERWILLFVLLIPLSQAVQFGAILNTAWSFLHFNYWPHFHHQINFIYHIVIFYETLNKS
jgi:hypothetical protein